MLRSIVGFDPVAVGSDEVDETVEGLLLRDVLRDDLAPLVERDPARRSTVAQVYDQIISDLTEAYEIFEETGRIKTADPTDIDGCVVTMHLARTYMI